MKEEYKEYSAALVLFDCVPVILFLISGLLIHSGFHSSLFLAGVLLSFAAGSCKVIWKMLVVTAGRDIEALTMAFRIMMPAGFAFMLLAVIFGAGRGTFATIGTALTSMPSGLLFLAAIAGMGLMDGLEASWMAAAVQPG